ncbi:hypothetical protein KUTeg_021462 [Tegillarca granosa]|uniref:DUF4371 domain-containing protein n=1 Tax=Tegillarca granosa TaxID=220873 RepID=A0ABQ9E3C8_TEGGR|nr:hypothetical protein KUTeg_021462 [Tegillarca granosa]
MGKRKLKIDSSINNRNKIPNLTFFGIITSKTIESEVETFNDDKENTHVAKKGKFLESWKFNRSWLTYDSEKHRDHSHKRAIEIIECSNSMIESRKRAMLKSKSAVIGALGIVVLTKLKDLKIDQHTFSHNQLVQEFQLSIAQVLQDELLSRVREFGIYSIMIDESSDISVQPIWLYLDEELGRVEPKTSFLSIRQLSLANADCIVAELLKALGRKGLQVKDMVGISTDGASVMVGCKTGVVTQLKSLNSSILSTHCIAHRLALSCGGAADRVPYLVQFQEDLNSIYKYFHNSPKKPGKVGGYSDSS